MHTAHWVAQGLQTFGLEDGYVPAGQIERQLVLFKYAMFNPERVQLEQVVSDVQAMHLGSQGLQRLGFDDV